MQGAIRTLSVELYNNIIEGADYWKDYIMSETKDAVFDIWQDAKPMVQGYLDDVRYRN